MEAKLTFTAGVLIRGSVARSVKTFLFSENADFSLEEDRGWLESQYYLTIRGSQSHVLANVVQRWMKNLES